ncbi:methyltransferase family protein [Desulfovibrio sp. TomC]|uniref:methyltransferase family protein n=1 Tax=Desulfovibrio sp. TomC TaxID=1562888 RepID=UPI00069DF9CC|nr:isoprenylcysteine carboxylmethyltransferase family protein [Desulfovibrio sp. TomC]
MADVGEYLSILCAWAVLHSLSMSRHGKLMLSRFLGPRFAFYRLGFTVVSLASFGLTLALLPHLPQTLYHAHGLAAWTLWTIRLAAILFFLSTFKAFDLWEFTGIRQAALYPAGIIGPDGETAPSAELIVTGPYRIVRHPMYLAAVAYLFADPVMTLERVLFATFALAYFLVGSIFEERRLLAAFGLPYRAYQETTPRLVPWPLPFRMPANGKR